MGIVKFDVFRYFLVYPPFRIKNDTLSTKHNRSVLLLENQVNEIIYKRTAIVLDRKLTGSRMKLV